MQQVNGPVVQLVNVEELIQKSADILYDLYEDNTEDGVTSYEGCRAMKDFFGEVPLTVRGLVFKRFLERLQEEGIEYDAQIFQKAVH